LLGWLSYRISDLDFWTIHTDQTVEALKDSLSSLQDVETGERGFMLTNDKIFPEPYRWGNESGRKFLDKIESLTSDNAAQQVAVKRLRQLADAKIKITRENVEKGHSDSSVREGKRVMDLFRVQVHEMITREESLLEERTESLHTTQFWLWIIVFVLSLVSVLFLAWVYRISRSSIEEEKVCVDQLSTEIEQRKRIEGALKITAINLTRSNLDLQQFAYVASHDLQEPLRAITGFLSLLQKRLDTNLDEQSQRYIRHSIEGAHRMRTLVNDLLTYARVESRAEEFKTIDLNKILERVELDLQNVIQETETRVISDSLPSIMGEPTQMAQFFQNLISNAIKFRGDKSPVIVIKVKRQGDDWEFSVQDNGRGFDMEHAERIFIIFQRLQGRDQAEGTGIGLALCKKIVDRHGGKIWVDAVPDKGATFYFTLPAIAEG
jgi:signal transduction histidine kinase